MVSDPELTRQIRQQYSGKMGILYNRILWHRKITKNTSDTLWNINLNVPARSMKGILMLFEDPDKLILRFLFHFKHYNINFSALLGNNIDHGPLKK